jgi:hypothetical protein
MALSNVGSVRVSDSIIFNPGPDATAMISLSLKTDVGGLEHD